MVRQGRAGRNLRLRLPKIVFHFTLPRWRCWQSEQAGALRAQRGGEQPPPPDADAAASSTALRSMFSPFDSLRIVIPAFTIPLRHRGNARTRETMPSITTPCAPMLFAK